MAEPSPGFNFGEFLKFSCSTVLSGESVCTTSVTKSVSVYKDVIFSSAPDETDVNAGGEAVWVAGPKT